MDGGEKRLFVEQDRSVSETGCQIDREHLPLDCFVIRGKGTHRRRGIIVIGGESSEASKRVSPSGEMRRRKLTKEQEEQRKIETKMLI